MNLRALCLTLLAAAAFVPSANATVADAVVPIYDASDGVRLVHSATGEAKIRFDAKAAKIYKTIAGKRAEIRCGAAVAPSGNEGPLIASGFSVSGTETIPKRRGSVRLGTSNDVEFCSLSTKETKRDRACMPPDRESKLCVRVAVAVLPAGATYLDAKERTIELAYTVSALDVARTPDLDVPGATLLAKMQTILGSDIVGLATPDDTPPAGKVGLWTDDAKSFAVVTLLADGTRRFVRLQDGVFSTNDLALNGLANEDVFTLS